MREKWGVETSIYPPENSHDWLQNQRFEGVSRTKHRWFSIVMLDFRGFCLDFPEPTLTASSPMKIDGWKMQFPFGERPIFKGELLVLGSVDQAT